MKLSPTLSVYIGRQFLLWFGIMFGGLAGLVLLFDTLELLRRAATREQATAALVLELALLRLPHFVQLLVPFAVLFGGMTAFWRLTRSSELVVARAAGISVWQFLLPALAVTCIIAAVKIGLVGPFASVLLARSERLEDAYLRGHPNLMSISPSGLWLRQTDGDGHALLHARRVVPEAFLLETVTVFRFDADDRFYGRIDAESAALQPGRWIFRDAWLTGRDTSAERRASLSIETDLTWRRIEESFARPETLSVWRLPAFIATLESAGFSALRHRLHLHGMLASPVLLCAMVLIAATIALRPGRRGGTSRLVAGGLATGFALYVASDIVFALGLSGRVPVELAAWAPASVCMLLGITTLLHLEDG